MLNAEKEGKIDKWRRRGRARGERGRGKRKGRREGRNEWGREEERDKVIYNRIMYNVLQLWIT